VTYTLRVGNQYLYGQSVVYGQTDTVPEFSTAAPEYSTQYPSTWNSIVADTLLLLVRDLEYATVRTNYNVYEGARKLSRHVSQL